MIISVQLPGLCGVSFVTSSFSFSFQFKNSPKQQFQDHSFSPGLHVIYGESGVGKSELINLLADEGQYRSASFIIGKINRQKDMKIILQNPDLQILRNTIENELAFSLECNSNNTNFIKQQLDHAKNKLLFSANTDRHPVTLSGGEKELLNISTTFLLPNSIILIDDALSFLSNRMKRKVVDKFFTKKQNEHVIIWFTSDESDLMYGDTKWELTPSKISKIRLLHLNELPLANLQRGEYNLEIDRLNFHYDSKNPIFNDFSEFVNNFRCLGIIGNNGCGKSTLASLLLKLEKPISGSIKLNCTNIKDIEIGYLDQFPEKLLGVKTLENFIQLLIINEKLDSSQLSEINSNLRVNNIIWENIKDILALDLSWTTLRIALIIILSNCNYDLLILDEPTFGMGSQQKLNLYYHFISYLEEKHLILISHDQKYISSICDSIIKL
jgi:energy-coupling factor transporter ATP-binding protein EcfA2